jgi:hypothetical protein
VDGRRIAACTIAEKELAFVKMQVARIADILV